MSSDQVFEDLIAKGTLKKCKLCNKRMRIIENQEYLITIREEWNISTIEEVRNKLHSSDLYELTLDYCQHCSTLKK